MSSCSKIVSLALKSNVDRLFGRQRYSLASTWKMQCRFYNHKQSFVVELYNVVATIGSRERYGKEASVQGDTEQMRKQ